MTTRGDKLRSRMAALRAELSEIEDAEREAAARAIIGRCFKYHNAGGGEPDGVRWWLYAIVTGPGDHGHARATEFQQQPSGRVEVRTETWFDVQRMGGWTEIPRAEFDAAWARMESHIALLRPARPARRRPTAPTKPRRS